MKIISCDFETTTNIEDCRVWAVGVYDIYTEEFECGKDIAWLFRYFQHGGNCKAYFHNLKFDGAFIIDWLYCNNFTFTTNKKLFIGQFGTLISDKNMFYSIKVKINKGCTITFLDSLKIIPFSVRVISSAFGLEMSKGEIDYHAERPIGYELTNKDIDYLKRDCTIVGQALKVLFSQNLDRMTQGSNAMHDFKTTLPRKFEKIFPPQTCDGEIRAAYKGGFTYVNPKYQAQNLGYGRVYDKNSMYPSMMKYKLMPYDNAKYYNGKYTTDKIYTLYIQKIKVIFELKENHIPTIQIKSGFRGFIPTEYVTSSNDEEVILTLTCVDLELFLDQYNVYDIEYIEGWKFKATSGLFDNYIDKWYKIKEEATKTGNKGMRTLAKLMLNALYGKFATSTIVQSKEPYYDKKGQLVKYKLGEKERREPVYLPVACFITAYSRADVIRNAQANYERFAYSDTDSLHFIGKEEPKGMVIDSYKLGAWAHETIFHKARFLRAKCYIELLPLELKHKINGSAAKFRQFKLKSSKYHRLHKETSLVVTCAGMPYSCHKSVTWENFTFGAEYEGKMRFKIVKGGAVLIPTPFKIKSG